MKLRHAQLNERRKTFDWYANIACQDADKLWTEGQEYTYGEFAADFEDFFYMEEGKRKGGVMIAEVNGEEVGCVCYTCFHLKKGAAELDIWLKDEKVCGKGYGTAAIMAVISYLKADLGTQRFIIRPAEKNTRAIRAYEKAGFRRVTNKMAAIDDYMMPEYTEVYGGGDYGAEETALLVLE